MTVSSQAGFRLRVERLGQLPTLPFVVERIIAMAERPETSAEDLGRIIEKDQVLAAKVLRLANSPFYGFPARIASVSHAVVVLGLNVVKGLTLGATIFDLMKDAGMDHLWRHSLGVAMTARILAKHAGQRNTEEVFVAGLLHDLGKVVLCAKMPDLARAAADAARARDLSMQEAEQEVLGLTHADIAGWLAESWHLPIVLKEPMMFHHHPALARVAPKQTAIVHVADILVKAMGCGSSGDELVPALSPDAWQTVGLRDETLDACLDQAANEFETIDDFL
jgi:HD-like signal output (HDOD) protein